MAVGETADACEAECDRGRHHRTRRATLMLTARDPDAAARVQYDCIVVGGGIHGVMAALEATRCGLRPLLLERGDFGAATSYSSLGIIHGGLRYLQSLDLARFRASVRERGWFLRHFPDCVEPLPCLMPLYNQGLKRPTVMRAALLANDLLTRARNTGVYPARHLPTGRVLHAEAVRVLAPDVEVRGLVGGAVWYDGFARDTQHLLLEALRWAGVAGAVALNYVEAVDCVIRNGRVAGVRARDLVNGTEREYAADVVLNAAGPWARRFSAACGDERADLCEPMLAWNVVLRRTPPSDHALAVQPRRRGGQTYFLVPWKGVQLVGTGYAPWHAGLDTPRPTPEMLDAFLADLNEAMPSLAVSRDDVAAVFAGVLPARASGSAQPAQHNVIVDHGAHGGPAGLISLSGVKFTTARRVAEEVVRRAFPGARRQAGLPRPEPEAVPEDRPFEWMPAAGDIGWYEEVRQLARDPFVVHVGDALLRRSTLGDNPARAVRLAPEACRLLGYDEARTQAEIERLCRELDVQPPDDARMAQPVHG